MEEMGVKKKSRGYTEALIVSKTCWYGGFFFRDAGLGSKTVSSESRLLFEKERRAAHALRMLEEESRNPKSSSRTRGRKERASISVVKGCWVDFGLKSFRR
ncbi:hypothetical protein TNCV_2359771 [Trichonephila clavipes]|nr:hypothetical protein TNCV_2359771 [Trichonephila clavipes]